MGSHGGFQLPAIYIIEVVIGIGLLIFIHELGHFVVAKLSGVKVERFSLGFGPELVGFTKADTRYSLRAIPVGGYVKMLGDEPGSDAALSEQSFLAQPFRKKAAIIVAGAFMNIILALAMFVAVFQIGVSFPAAILGMVEYGSPAWQAGVRVGDRVVEVNGKRDVDFVTLQMEAALSDPGQPVHLLVQRDSQEVSVDVFPAYSPAVGMPIIGVERSYSMTIAGIGSVDALGSPAQRAGVPAGAVIKAVNGREVTNFLDFRRALLANGLKTFGLTFAANGAERTVEVTPVRPATAYLNVLPTYTTEVTEVAADGPAAAVGLQPGDIVVGVGDADVAEVFDLREAIDRGIRNVPPLRVRRGDREVTLSWKEPPASGSAFIDETSLKVKVLPIVAYVPPSSPAEHIGLRRGDQIVSVDGREVKEAADIDKFTEEAKGDYIAVAWRRDGSAMTGSFQPVAIGIAPAEEVVLRRLGLAGSCKMGVAKAWEFTKQIYILLKKIFSGRSGIAKNLSGPVGIAKMSYTYAQRGFSDLLFFLAIIGVNLGVVNLLPIPILDGGLLAIFAVEKVRGKPLGPAALAVLQYIGLAVIVLLFLYVTFNDIMRLITGRM